VRETAEYSNWPELAGAKLAESSGTGRNSYIGAQRGAQKSSNLLKSSKSTEHGVHVADDNARFVPEVRNSYIVARTWGSKSLLLENEYSSSTNNGVSVKEPRSLLLDSMEEDGGVRARSLKTEGNTAAASAQHSMEAAASAQSEGKSTE